MEANVKTCKEPRHKKLNDLRVIPVEELKQDKGFNRGSWLEGRRERGTYWEVEKNLVITGGGRDIA